jgi:hypothetical protein
MAAPDKQQKREARQLRDAVRGAWERGDYGEVRRLSLKVLEIAPETDLANESAKDLENLRPDKIALYVGVGSVALLVASWGISFLL